MNKLIYYTKFYFKVLYNIIILLMVLTISFVPCLFVDNNILGPILLLLGTALFITYIKIVIEEKL